MLMGTETCSNHIDCFVEGLHGSVSTTEVELVGALLAMVASGWCLMDQSAQSSVLVT